MAFDPVTLLTIAIVVLFALGALMLQSWRGDRACAMPMWSGFGFLSLGAGFGLVLAAPTDIDAPVRILGNAAILLSYGLLWAAARRFAQRPVSLEPICAGALTFLVLVTLFVPSQTFRTVVSSLAVAAYAGATALEHRRGDGVAGRAPLPSQHWASILFTAHAGFFGLRAIFGLLFGSGGPRQVWGALLGCETVLFAILAGVATIAMSRDRSERLHRREALEDVLTGIGNRRALFRSGPALLAASRESARPAALLLMDLDGFKAINDSHGHPAGDRLLVAFARLAHDYLPPNSLVCRVGGEEFAAILPAADRERARAVGDEIRALFAHVTLDGPHGPLRGTVSVGVAEMRPDAVPEGDLIDLLGRADLCLYAAKRSGRDRVVAEGDAALSDPSLAPASRRTAA